MREHLPEEFVERNLNWLRREGAKDAWINVLNNPSWIVLVAEEGKSIVGVAQGHVDWGNLSHLGFLGVDRGYRNRGIGRGLLDKFVERAWELGAEKISLETSPALKPAVKLYAEAGFLPEGFLRRHRLGVDMIVYSKFV
jgi:ribosomal protein S18 acetylase RimI-like enzyme